MKPINAFILGVFSAVSYMLLLTAVYQPLEVSYFRYYKAPSAMYPVAEHIKAGVGHRYFITINDGTPKSVSEYWVLENDCIEFWRLAPHGDQKSHYVCGEFSIQHL